MKNQKLGIVAVVVGFAIILNLGFTLRVLEEPMIDQSLATLRAYTVSCGTTKTALAVPAGGKSIASLRVWNNSATAVYIGGDDVNTSTKGMPICTSASCVGADQPADTRSAQCRVASGTVDVIVLVGEK